MVAFSKQAWASVLAAGAMTAGVAAQTQSCANNVLPIPQPCEAGSRPGIFYMRENDGVVREFNPRDGRLDVGDNGRLAVQYCNVGNENVRDFTVPLDSSLIPTVVGNVGTRGLAKVEIVNSANIEATGEVVVGMKIAEGELTDDFPDASLIAEVVKGSLGRYAEVSVEVKDSANVYLDGSSAELWIGKGTLLQEIVNVDPTQHVQDACVEVQVHGSANVQGRLSRSRLARRLDDEASANDGSDSNGDNDERNPGFPSNPGSPGGPTTPWEPGRGAKVYIRDGQLDDETIDLPSYCDRFLGLPCGGNDGKTSGGTLVISKVNVANIRDVEDIFIWEGELSDESVDVGELSDSNVNLNFENLGNAHAHGYIRIVGGELVDEMFDATSITGSAVNVFVTDVGNAKANVVEIVDGELVDEIVDVEQDLSGSIVRVDCFNIANSETATHYLSFESELLDEVLDVSGNIRSGSQVDINLRASANSRCGGENVHRMDISNGELLDSVVDVWQIDRNSGVRVTLFDTANAHSSNVNLVNATIMDPAIDQSFGSCNNCVVTETNSGAVLGRC